MLTLAAGRLTKRIEIWRDGAASENALGEAEPAYALYITRWASKDVLSVSERLAERLAAAQNQATQGVKFTVRNDAETATITENDRVRFEGVDYDIKAVREYGERVGWDLYCMGVQVDG